MGRPKITFIKNCATCGNSFNPGKHKQKLNCSPECLIIYKEKHKDERMKKTFDAIEEKYGVRTFAETDGFGDKIKQIKKDKYGDEKYNNFEKIQQTLKEKFNVDSPGELPNNDEKIKQTKLNKFNDPNYNNRDKAKKTIKERFGTDHHLQTEASLKKLRETNTEKYGHEYTILTKKSKENLLKHNQLTFNADYYFSSNKHKNSILNQKIKRIDSVLKSNNLKFDTSEHERLRKRLSDGSLTYIKYNITCETCQNTFESSFEIAPVCRKCFPLTSVSKQQSEFKLFLDGLKVKYIENTRKIIGPFELDFYLPDHKIAIELNGNYYHSELSGKLKNYHLNKSILCNSMETKLVHIFEDEWMNKKEIIKSRIKNMMGLSDLKIFARQCTISEISFNEKKEFLEENHIQSNDTSFYNIGMFYKNVLCSVMTFSKPRLALGTKKNVTQVELSRFASKINYNIPGAFQKLLTFFIKNHKDISEIITYADCRWSGLNNENTIYNKAGFDFIHLTPPNYFYMFRNNYFNRYHRFTYNKQKLIKLFAADKSLTEWDMAKLNNMDRIWDCGSMKFSLKIP